MNPFLRRFIRQNIILAALGTIISASVLVARDQSGDSGSISTANKHTKPISAAQDGKSYPFTVDGQLICQSGTIFLKVGDTLYYRIFGTAQNKM